MKGSAIFIEPFQGGYAAALVENGVLQDVLIDGFDGEPALGAIYRVRVDKPVKGLGGTMVALGSGQRGFLREAKGLRPGQHLLAQVSSYAETGKATPMSTKLMFKGRYAIVTPGAAGINVARSIKDPEERDRLAALGKRAMQGSEHGLILRSAALEIDADAVEEDVSHLREVCEQLMNDGGTEPELLVDAPDARHLAWREWDADEVIEEPNAFDLLGLWEQIEAVKAPLVSLGSAASMKLEATAALVAVDVNTGGDFSTQAGLTANRLAADALPRALRLRGLGGQITIDFAPMPKSERRGIEAALRSALKRDPVETSIAGWTPLGHLELLRKRDRRPISEVLK